MTAWRLHWGHRESGLLIECCVFENVKKNGFNWYLIFNYLIYMHFVVFIMFVYMILFIYYLINCGMPVLKYLKCFLSLLTHPLI